jgi:hypothetical protein
VVDEEPLDLLRQRGKIGEVGEADRTAPDLVLVGRPDAPARRADLRAGRRPALAQQVEVAMQGEDERRIVGDPEVFGRYGDALPRQLLDLGYQRMRVQHDAVADDRELARADDAGGQQAQLEGGAADDQRVAGIVAALEAHHHVGALRQPVDDLALAFVAPLRADDHHIGHDYSLQTPPKRLLKPIPKTGIGYRKDHAQIQSLERLCAAERTRGALTHETTGPL